MFFIRVWYCETVISTELRGLFVRLRGEKAQLCVGGVALSGMRAIWSPTDSIRPYISRLS